MHMALPDSYFFKKNSLKCLCGKWADSKIAAVYVQYSTLETVVSVAAPFKTRRKSRSRQKSRDLCLPPFVGGNDSHIWEITVLHGAKEGERKSVARCYLE